VLALTGALDVQVDPDDLERIARLVDQAPVETHRIPQVNHVLRHSAGSGAPSEYERQVKSGRPLDPRVLHTVTAWAGRRASVPACPAPVRWEVASSAAAEGATACATCDRWRSSACWCSRSSG